MGMGVLRDGARCVDSELAGSDSLVVCEVAVAAMQVPKADADARKLQYNITVICGRHDENQADKRRSR